MTSTPSVAVLGTGTMGAPMARNLLAAGLEVRAWNRSPEKARPLADDGATVPGSAADAVRGADVVLTMLDAAQAVAETVESAADGLAEGQVWLQMATVGLEGCDELAALAQRFGLIFVDAPVLGTKKPAEDGTLVVLAGGPEAARETVAPVLDAVGGRTLWLGEAGAGSRMKLVANSWILAVTSGAAEAIALAQALGVDPRSFLDAVAGGPLDLPYLQLKGGAMLDEEFPPSFSVVNALKDAGLVEDAAAAAGVRNGIAAVAGGHLTRARDAGHGDADMAAAYLGVVGP